MKTSIALSLTALFLVPACGPGKASIDDESGSASGTSSGGETASGDTDVAVPQCYYGEQNYDVGDTFDTPDGCVSYACEATGLVAVADNRITINENLALGSQEEVDANKCLGLVEGDLAISGTAADLTPLAQLSRVGGTLSITGTQAVTFEGFGMLTEIGASIVIADNPNLTTMAFQPYMSVFGDATIQNNDSLQSLSGAEFMGQCGSCAIVDDGVDNGQDDVAGPLGLDGTAGGDGGGSEGGAGAPAGDEGGADQAGGTFYGSILIADNDVLADVSAMSNLWSAWADVRFRSNPALASLSTLQLSQVQGDLEISNHAAMATADVDSFVANIEVWGATTICGNQGGEVCPE